MRTIKLDRLTVNHDQVNFDFSVDDSLQKYFRLDNHLFFKYNYDISDVPVGILSIPWVANIIPLTWITDTELVVDELDRQFFESLSSLKQAYQNMFPNMPLKGAIRVHNIVDHSYVPEREAGVLFSGGLDATTTFIRHQAKNPLLITEYGWHENEILYSDVWEADREYAIAFAQKEGLENILIESNYGGFVYPHQIDRDYKKKLGDTWWHGLHHGLAIISAAIPVVFKLKVENMYIASSHTIGNTFPCASDPTTDSLIKYGSGGVIHDAYELSRQDKIKVVIDHFVATNEKIVLRVCHRNRENCCNCEKCLRTIMGIVAEGSDPNNFGFPVPENISSYLMNFFKINIKSLTNIQINNLWIPIQYRMRGNSTIIKQKELLDWFPDYDFVANRRKELLRYRVTQFFPIIKRKLNSRFKQLQENR